MPIYEYRCSGCGAIFEKFFPVSAGDELTKTKCKHCGESAPRCYAFTSFSSPGAIDTAFSEDEPAYREMHYYEKKKDWDKAAKAAEGVSEFAKTKFIQKAQQEG